MSDAVLQLKEESVPSLDDLDRNIQEIPTIEITSEEPVEGVIEEEDNVQDEDEEG